MMSLPLTSEEALELVNALELRLHTMMDELVHTDDRRYKEDLKARYARLENVQTRLAARLSLGEAAPQVEDTIRSASR